MAAAAAVRVALLSGRSAELRVAPEESVASLRGRAEAALGVPLQAAAGAWTTALQD
ncbi:unnamed protein product [Prorocentrum cordatum]|uniref:Ubiquitin-like domain-containing protein n=1 Tax=Prorocentrum cordatum TaxID=2364126 RepID=A0ABN9YF89_9DINO|nr:unnamed protein product [Polarella glacialis]